MRRTARLVLQAIPAPVRHGLRRLSVGVRIRDWAFRGPRSHDELYGAGYFEMVERTTGQSAQAMASSIRAAFDPTSVVDVGCGTGTLLAHLRALGVDGVGLEYARAALDVCRERGLDVRRFDIETDRLPDDFGRCDLAISMEVGQQLKPASSGRYVDLLCSISDVVVFSSAVPGQGDRSPQNEQPHAFWVELFAERGYSLDSDITDSWRRDWAHQGTSPWFAANVMVFRSEG